MCLFFFFFKQKTAYEMRISDWSSDVCSSDLSAGAGSAALRTPAQVPANSRRAPGAHAPRAQRQSHAARQQEAQQPAQQRHRQRPRIAFQPRPHAFARPLHRFETVDLRVDAGQLGGIACTEREIGRANVLTPVTNAKLVCSFLLYKNNNYS